MNTCITVIIPWECTLHRIVFREKEEKDSPLDIFAKAVCLGGDNKRAIFGTQENIKSGLATKRVIF